ncbi:kinase-like protein [Rhizophagus irregularis]|uniref:Kinase-like protein n=1 Tax=Rhizophagus irregularis TaxID=588596 RepID=A0A2I1GSM0_9GLOM|nr:kinase-like protein [Rhizophagus irregularis]
MASVSLNEWISKKIKEGEISYLDYSDLSDLRMIDKESGVKRANWVYGRAKLALKVLINNPTINEENMNKLLIELNNLMKVNFHPCINTFFGITKEPSSNNYMMALQYANQGNLRDYLKRNFRLLQWAGKIKMALDIARGLKCLHARNIVHRDLHAKNILIHKNRLMIADLGLSKQLTVEITSTSYVEPQFFTVANYITHDQMITDDSKITNNLMISDDSKVANDPMIIDDSNVANDSIITNDPKIIISNDSTNTNDPIITNDSKITGDSKKDEKHDRSGSSPLREYKISKPLPLVFNNIEDESRLLSSILDEIVQVYLEYNNIGWTNNFDFDEVLEKYKSKARKIFDYLIENSNIKHYEVMIGKFYRKGNEVGLEEL